MKHSLSLRNTVTQTKAAFSLRPFIDWYTAEEHLDVGHHCLHVEALPLDSAFHWHQSPHCNIGLV